MELGHPCFKFRDLSETPFLQRFPTNCNGGTFEKLGPTLLNREKGFVIKKWRALLLWAHLVRVRENEL